MLQYLLSRGVQVHVAVEGNMIASSNKTTVDSIELGSFSPSMMLCLCVSVDRRRSLMPLVLHRDQNKCGEHEFQLLQDGRKEESCAYFYYNLQLAGQFPRGYTLWPDNQVHVVLFAPKGTFEIMQISLSSQRNVVYLRAQRIYQGVASRSGDSIVVSDPNFQPWEKMLPFLAEVMKRRKLEEPAAFEVKSWEGWVDETAHSSRPIPPPKYVEDIPTGQALIQFFNESMGIGWGVARNNNGELVQCKVHWSAIEGQKGSSFKTLPEGSLVTFRDLKLRQHVAGPDNGKARFEIVGVRLVGDNN